ncbi:hypothetical protein AB4452_04695 [Vibrio lentus]
MISNQQQVEQKMIQIADDFAFISDYLKEQLSLSAYKSYQKQEDNFEHFKTNKIKHDYLTELSNVMGNLKEDLNND